MKPHERRAKAAYPYYKVAVWDRRNLTWRDGRVAYATHADAMSAVRAALRKQPTGNYRISTVTEEGRTDGPEILDPECGIPTTVQCW